MHWANWAGLWLALVLPIWWCISICPRKQTPLFPNFIFQGALLGVIAVLGLINFGGRIFDAITDPLIASFSDKKVSKFGKRKYFMAIAAIPFALLSFLIFYPISGDETVNTGWLLGTVFLFYFFMTLYVVPYTALISELGHYEEDRLVISTFISLTWAMGFLLGNTVYVLQEFFEQSMDSVAAFQYTVGIFALVSLVFMLVPVFLLDENKYCRQGSTSNNFGKSLLAVFANRNFRFFVFSDLMYWLSLTFMQLGVSYYVTILMGLEKSFASLFMAIALFSSFLIYIPINILAKRWGKKILVIISFAFFCVLFATTFFIQEIGVATQSIFYVLAVLSAVPMAGFGILPNAIVADIVHEDEMENGEQQAGMFYAVRAFGMKLGISLANLIFPSLLLLGKSTENPFGIKLTAACAFVFCLLGLLLFFAYKEKNVPVKS